jgi:hypothetical protein
MIKFIQFLTVFDLHNNNNNNKMGFIFSEIPGADAEWWLMSFHGDNTSEE